MRYFLTPSGVNMVKDEVADRVKTAYPQFREIDIYVGEDGKPSYIFKEASDRYRQQNPRARLYQYGMFSQDMAPDFEASVEPRMRRENDPAAARDLVSMRNPAPAVSTSPDGRIGGNRQPVNKQQARQLIAREEIDKAPFLALDEMLSRYPGENPNIRITEQRARVRQEHIREIAEPFSMGMTTKQYQYYRNAREWADDANGLQRLGENVLMGAFDFFTSPAQAINPGSELADFSTYERQGVNSAGGTIEQMLNSVAYSIPQTLGMLAFTMGSAGLGSLAGKAGLSAIASGAARAGSIATKAAGYGMTGAQILAPLNKDDYDKGRLNLSNVLVNVGSSAVQTAIEYLTLGSQMGRIQQAWKSGGKLAVSNLAQGYVKDALEVSLKQFGKPILMSGLQEGAEEIAQGITEKMFNLIKGDSLPNAEEWAKELAMSFVGGMLGGLVFGTVGSGVQMTINNKVAQTLQYNATRYPNSVAHLNQAIIHAQNQQWEDAMQNMLLFEKGNAYDKVFSPEIQKAYNLVSDALRMYDAGIILEQQKKRATLHKERSKLFHELKVLKNKFGPLTDQEEERMLLAEDRLEVVRNEISKMLQQQENVKSFRDIQRLAKEIAVTEAQIKAMEDGEEKLALIEQNKQKLEQLQIMDANLKESIAALMQTMPKAEQRLVMGEKYPAHAVLGAQQTSETGQPAGDQQQTQPGTLPGQTTPQEQPGNTPKVLTAEEREAQRKGIKIDQSQGMKAGDVNEMIDRSDPESLEEGVKPVSGKETKVRTSSSRKITARWILVKLKDLVVSNDPMSFSENKEYPGEIQNRKRDRAALREQVENIAKEPDPELLASNPLGQYGAPVIFRDKSGRWVVLGGNGRVMGLKRRVAQLGEGSLQEYEDYVKDHLSELGFDPDTDTTGMVLVRDYYGDEDVIEMSRELNSSETAEISSMEQASGDAVTIANAIRKGNNIFDFLDYNQPLTPDKQEAFYGAFYKLCVKDGNQYLTSGGNYNSKMQERVEMAMWMYLFNGDRKAEDLLSDYFETEESNIKSIITGIIDNMPLIISLRRMTEKYNLPDYDISQTVLDAISTISTMKRKKIALEKIIEETDIFSENRNVIQEDKITFYRALLTIKSMKAGRAFFGGYYADALDALDPEQDSFLLDLADSNPEEYLNEYAETWIKNEKEKERQRAERAAARANQKSDPASLDTGGDAQKTDTEARQSRNLKNQGLPGREETIQSVKNALGFNNKTDKVSVSDDGRTVTFDTADGRHVILNLHKNVIQGSYGPSAGQMSREVIDGKLTYIIDLVEAFNSGNRTGYHEAFHMAWFMSSTVEQRKFLEKHYTRLILNGKAYDENGRIIHMSQAKWESLSQEERSVYIEEQAAMGAEAVWGARGDVLPTMTNKILQRIGDLIRRALVARGWATENMKLEDIFVRAGTGKLNGTGVQMDGTGKLNGTGVQMDKARNKPLIGLDAAMKIDKNAAMTSIQKAMDMEKAGKSREDIWEATGWERSAIGTFKTEIPAPLSSELRMDKVTYRQWDDRARAASGYIEDVAVGSTATFAFVDFGDIYPSKYIEDAYGADIANIDVLFVKNETGAEHGGFWSPSRKMIVISSRQDISPQLLNSDSFRRWTLEVLVHELQHAIQTNEGDSEGTPRSYDTQNPEYQVATHEVEARNAERRAMQRERGVTANASLSATEDVDRSKQESLWRNIQINGNEVRIHGDKGEDQYQQYFNHEAADALKTIEMRTLENKIVGLTTAPNTMLDTVIYIQNNLYNRIIDSNIIKDIRDKDTSQIDAKMNRVRRWMNAHMSEGLNQDQIPLVRKLMSLLRKQLHDAKVQDLGRDKDNMSTKQRAYARALVDEDAMLRLFQDSGAEVGLMENIADMLIAEIKRYNSPDKNSETGKYIVTAESLTEARGMTIRWLNEVMAEEQEAWKKLGLDNGKNTLEDIEKADPDGSKRETAGWTDQDFDEAFDALHLIGRELYLAVKKNTDTVTRNKLAKRYGVKADVVTLKAPQSWRGNAEFNHLTITPEMRQDMLQQGLPRYKMAPMPNKDEISKNDHKYAAIDAKIDNLHKSVKHSDGDDYPGIYDEAYSGFLTKSGEFKNAINHPAMAMAIMDNGLNNITIDDVYRKLDEYDSYYAKTSNPHPAEDQLKHIIQGGTIRVSWLGSDGIGFEIGYLPTDEQIKAIENYFVKRKSHDIAIDIYNNKERIDSTMFLLGTYKFGDIRNYIYSVYGAAPRPISAIRFKQAPDTAEIAEAERQMEEVRSKYEGTDQWLKAPNGKPTKLNERQWLQVRTENFKKWFGDWENDRKNASKVLDKNREPRVVYHGGASKSFSVFKYTKDDNTAGSKAIFFTNSNEVADSYAASSEAGKYNWDESGPNVYPVFLRIINPGIRDAKGQGGNGGGSSSIRGAVKKAVYDGNDGVIVRNVIDEVDYEIDYEKSDEEGAAYKYRTKDKVQDLYVVFGNTQIKSATANVGTFDAENPDIRYKLVDDDLFKRLQETPPLPVKPWMKYIKELEETGKLDHEGYTKSIQENSETYEEALKAWTEQAPDMIPLKADFGTALISKDPSMEDPKRPWRATWFTKKLEPAGHKLYATKLEAVKDTVSDYREFDPNTRFKKGPLYHGTGAFFDRFDLKFIGTGEGAQAFGWGIYVTERRGVAKDYAERLGTRPKLLTVRIGGKEVALRNDIDVVKLLKNEQEYIFKNQSFDQRFYTLNYLKSFVRELLEDDYGYGYDDPESIILHVLYRHIRRLNVEALYLEGKIDLLKYREFIDIDIDEVMANVASKGYKIGDEYIEDILDKDPQKIPNQNKHNAKVDALVRVKDILSADKVTLDTEPNNRNLYTVSVWENHTEDVLEWYGKITDEQIRKINAALLAKKGKQGDLAKLEKIDGKIYAIDKLGVRVPVPNGQYLYATISASTTRTKERTSKFLLDAGIDGIKYPVSALSGGTGDKGWNYVVFDDSQIKIEKHERFKMIPEEMLRRMEEAMKLADSSRPNEVIDQTVTSTSEQKGLDQQQVKDKIGRAIRAAYREGNERVQNVLAASTIAGIDRYIETNKPETRDRDDLTYHLEEAEEDAYQKDLGLSAAEAMNLGKDRFNFYLGGLKVFAMGNAIMEDLMKARQESARLREQGITDEALEEKIAVLTGMVINSKLTYDNIKGNAGRILRHAREEKSRALQQYTKLMETMQKDEAELYDQIAELQAEIEAQEALMAELETAITELESMQTDLIESSEDLIQKVDRVISGNLRFKQVDRMQQIEQLKQRQAELKRRGELAKARMEQMIAQAKATKDQMDKIGEVIDGMKPDKPPRITELPPMKPTFYDYVKSAMYQGMLSSPMTHFRNMVGNLTSLISELAVDIVNDPQGGMIALAQTIGAIPESIQAGIATFKDSKEYLKKYDLTKNTTKLMKYFTIITRLLAAEDAYGYNMAFTAQLASIAVMESRKPENVKAGVTYKSLIKNPTKEMLKQAQYEARRATFNYNPEGIIGIVIQQIDEGVKQAEKTGALGKAAAMGFKYNVMPFTRVVANVMSWGLEWTPLGYLMSFKYGSDSLEKQRQVWMDGKNPMASPYRQRDITRSLTRATLGTVMMIMAQVLFSEIISGGGPPDWEKRRQLMETGWRPYSIKIGDRWMPYNDYWLGTALAVIGNFNDYRRYSRRYNEATGWDKLSYAIMGIANTFLNKSFLSGMQNTLEAIADQRGSFISSQTAGFVGTMMPMANAIRMIGDIFYKDVHKPETLAQYLIVATRPLSLPVMDSVPKNIDVLGRPVKRKPFWHQITGSPDMHDKPFMVNNPGDDIPIDIRRTMNILADAQVRIPGAASFDIKIDEGRFTLKGHDRQTYREIRGEEVTLFIIDEMDAIEEARDNPEELQSIVSKLGSKATREAKKRIVELYYNKQLRHKYIGD